MVICGALWCAQELSKQISQVQKELELNTLVKMDEYRHKNTELDHRLVKVHGVTLRRR